MRIFINNIDSYVGKALCADLRSVLGQENRLFGTFTDDSAQVDEELVKNLGIKRVVSRSDRAKYLADILTCSLVVFDLHSSNFEDVEAVIKELKLAKLGHEITFVLISSANVWARTIKSESSYVPVEKGEDEEEDPAEEEGAPPPEDSTTAIAVLPSGELKFPSGGRAKFKEAKRPPVLTDADKDLRTPSADYDQWKYLESLTLALGPKEKLRPHVVCAGMLYGNGETLLNDLFKAAWLTQAVHVITKNPRGSIIEPGTNYVPCVHVRDVARLVRVVAVDKSAQPYLICVDKARHTQSDIVRGIVNHISNAREVPLVVSEAGESSVDLMSRVNAEKWMDLILKPSAPMRSKEFDWWCKDGLVANLEKVADEFCRNRNLLPIKSVVLGPPGAAVEKLGAKIAAKYLHEDPPHLTFDGILADALSAGTETKLKDKVAKVNAVPGKKLKLTTRTRLVRNKLLSNVCRYRGYVLENYPTTLEEAKALFMEKIPDEEADDAPEEAEESDVPEDEEEAAPAEEDAEEEDEPEEGFKETMRLNKAVAPEFVIVMQSSEERCKRRIFEGEASFEGGEEAFAAATRAYREANLMDDGTEGPAEFFEETGKVTVLRTDVDSQTPEELLHTVTTYVESKGSFFNYLVSEEQLLREETAKRDAEAAASAAAKAREAEEVKAAEDKLRKERAAGEAQRRKDITDRETATLETEATPLRQYLMANVVPTLSEGLTEVCKDMPEDPIEALAQYLFAHAQDITSQLQNPSNGA